MAASMRTEVDAPGKVVHVSHAIRLSRRQRSDVHVSYIDSENSEQRVISIQAPPKEEGGADLWQEDFPCLQYGSRVRSRNRGELRRKRSRSKNSSTWRTPGTFGQTGQVRIELKHTRLVWRWSYSVMTVGVRSAPRVSRMFVSGTPGEWKTTMNSNSFNIRRVPATRCRTWERSPFAGPECRGATGPGRPLRG